MILHACNKISFVKFAVLYLFFAPTFLDVVQGNDSNSKTDLKHAAVDSSFQSDSIAMRKAALLSRPYDQVARDSHSHQSIVSRELSDGRNTDTSFDPNSTTITNNIEWKDNNGNPLKNGRGGKIARIDGVWYWVGSEPVFESSGERGGNIYLYKSKSLGSNSWEFVRKLDLVNNGLDSRNCQIFKHPTLKTIHIFCRKAKIFTLEAGGSMKEGNFSLVRRGDPSKLDKKEWNWGNTNMFAKRGKMYMSVTRCKKSKGQCTTYRKAFIYRLNDSWTNFADENAVVAEWYWPNREAFHVVKRNRRWFIFASETQRWRQSKTWYRESRGLAGLATAPDREVVMHPSDTEGIKSMGTQFRFMQRVGRRKWVFGGSRHPHEDPDNFDRKYGIHVIVPMKFKEGIPHVYWKETFDLNTYDYDLEDYDQHNVDWYGPTA